MQVDRAFPGAPVVADLAAGHGLTAWVLVLLAAQRSVARTAVAVDVRRPASAGAVADAVRARWPALRDAVHYVEGSIDDVVAERDSVIVGVHACGALTDRVLGVALRSGAAAAVLPCCHSLRKQAASSLPALAELLPAEARAGLGAEALHSKAVARGARDAIDAWRAAAMRRAGYQVDESSIDGGITPFNRLLLCAPPSEGSPLLPPRRDARAAGHKPRLTGAVRAASRAAAIPLGNRARLAALAARPSTEWRRHFDVSFWLREGAPDRAAMLALLRRAVEARPGAAGPELALSASLRDEYEEPGTGRCAVTWRCEFASQSREISRADAAAWWAHVREGLAAWDERREAAPASGGGLVLR